MSDLVISPRIALELSAKLSQIQELSTARYLMLGQLSGTLLAEAGSLVGTDSSVFCALGAAAWSSSASMAKQLKEPTCRSLNLISAEKVIHIVPVGEKTLMIFVFDSEILPKGFRFLAWKWAEELDALLGMIGSSSRVSG
jgi:predicted regulator of Ras-like GTPase activity (Roadblock/LC7/MglB family)